MDPEGVERIANLVRDAGGEEGEGVEFFGLEIFFGGAARFGEVAHEHDGAEMAGGAFDIFDDGGKIEVEEAVLGVEDFEVAGDGGGVVASGEGVPVQSPHELGERLTGSGLGIETKEAGGGGVEEGDLAVGGENEDAFAEGFEDGLEEAFVAEEAIDEGLDLLGGQAVEAGKKFVDEGRLHTGR